MAGLSARVATVGELGVDDFARWRRLEERAAEPYPYLSADYLEPAEPHWPAALSVRLLLVEGDGELLLVMPFEVAVLHARIPLRVLSTAHPVLADESVRTYPLVDRERGVDALRTAFAALRTFGLPRLVEFSAVPADGVLEGLIAGSLASSGHRLARGRSRLALARFDETSAHEDSGELDVEPHHRSTSTRKQARQRRRALERACGAQLGMRDRSNDPAAVEDFLDLQTAGWKGDPDRHGLAYRLTGRERWLRELAARARANGRLVAFEMHAGGVPVYIALCIASGSTLFGLQDAYREEWGSLGVGNLGRTALVNWVAARGFDAFDPNMFWSYVESARLYADRRDQVQVLVAAGGALSRAQLGALRALMQARTGARALRDRVASALLVLRRGASRAERDDESRSR